VQTGNGALHARSLLLTAPVPQSLALLDAAGGVALAPADRGRLAAVRYHRCLALLLVLDRPASITGHGGALKLDHPDIQWIGNNQEKGLCPATPAVTVHSSAAFATAHWDSPDAQRVPHLLEAVAPFIRSRVTAWSCHRWRFAQPRCSFGEEAFCDRGLRLAIAGDGLAGGRVEGAAVSGLAAASGLLASPGAPVNPMTV
jgi:predicted NAD/FAD-dependent oxidoreductase